MELLLFAVLVNILFIHFEQEKKVDRPTRHLVVEIVLRQLVLGGLVGRGNHGIVPSLVRRQTVVGVREEEYHT